MLHGRPDFFGTPIHPKYGQFTQYRKLATVIANLATENIVDVSAKGLILGGFIVFATGLGDGNVTVIPTIDGELVAGLSVYAINRYRILERLNFPVFVLELDPDNEVVFGFGEGLPFEKSYSMTMSNNSGVQIVVSSTLFYGSVE